MPSSAIKTVAEIFIVTAQGTQGGWFFAILWGEIRTNVLLKPVFKWISIGNAHCYVWQ
jgi:hypothetical protein